MIHEELFLLIPLYKIMFLKVIVILLFMFNLYTFFLMGYDKKIAGSGKKRIPESRFFQLAIWGGSLGILIGISVWRHKTKKLSFRRNVYGICIAQILLLIFVGRFVF